MRKVYFRTVDSGLALLAQEQTGDSAAVQERKKDVVQKRTRTSTSSANQASKECNLAIILISTTVTFFMLHSTRFLNLISA